MVKGNRDAPSEKERHMLGMYGLTEDRNSDARARIWGRRPRKGLIIFAAEMPAPWGVCFDNSLDDAKIVWAIHLDTALYVLSMMAH